MRVLYNVASSVVQVLGHSMPYNVSWKARWQVPFNDSWKASSLIFIHAFVNNRTNSSHSMWYNVMALWPFPIERVTLCLLWELAAWKGWGNKKLLSRCPNYLMGIQSLGMRPEFNKFNFGAFTANSIHSSSPLFNFHVPLNRTLRSL